MAKIQLNCQISEEALALVVEESERLTKIEGRKVSEAEVIERRMKAEFAVAFDKMLNDSPEFAGKT